MNFFDASLVTKSVEDVTGIPKCGACGFMKKCKSPKLQVRGDGGRKILLVEEWPSQNDDQAGRVFSGTSGKMIKQALRKCGLDMDRDCWSTYGLICRPSSAPKNDHIRYCNPNLLKFIEDNKPIVCIAFGKFGIEAALSSVWKEGTGVQDRWIGYQIPVQKYNMWVCPNYSSTYLQVMANKQEYKVLQLWFDKVIAEAAKKTDYPWTDIPDYESQIRTEYDPSKVAKILDSMIKKGGAVSFDYETNMLKPDSDEAQIFSCAVSWRGEKTIAYPWTGEAIAATGRLLVSPVPKVGANFKFEERWTYKEFGHGVNNWVWDTMLSAHHLDNRRKNAAVKFQAFLRLGFSPWDDHIRPYLESDHANTPNQIHKLDMPSLLMYNGLDALIEYKLATLQKEVVRDGQVDFKTF